MLFLRGTLIDAFRVSGGMKHGVMQPTRNVLHIEIMNEQGVFQLMTLEVPDLRHFAGKTGQTVNVPVRAWGRDSPVRYVYAHAK